MLGSAQQAQGAAAQPNTADQKTGLREIDGLNAEIVMIKEKVGQKEREVRCRHALKNAFSLSLSSGISLCVQAAHSELASLKRMRLHHAVLL
jgi:hypothetical protein